MGIAEGGPGVLRNLISKHSNPGDLHLNNIAPAREPGRLEAHATPDERSSLQNDSWQGVPSRERDEERGESGARQY